MQIREIIEVLESFAPLELQEGYDNSGLIIGDKNTTVDKVLLSLDCTESVVNEAIEKGCNLIISHHPLVFGGLKRINNNDYVGRTVIKAIKNNIAIYACHTNIDNTIKGVNGKIADLLKLKERNVLAPKSGQLGKIVTFCPTDHAESVRTAMFEVNAGKIGDYDECSFYMTGTGTFRAGEGTNPYVGEQNKRHEEGEVRIEMIFSWPIMSDVVNKLIKAHPYEEVAYDIYRIENKNNEIGSGLIGKLENEIPTKKFLKELKDIFQCGWLKHSDIVKDKISTVAVCGGSGSFLIPQAIRNGADIFITADLKYHQFFDADEKIILCDIGHYESEQFTPHVIHNILNEKFPTFAFHFSEVNTNPVNYL